MANSVPPASQDRDGDRLFRALSHRRRRTVLRELQREETVGLPTLTESIARREREGPADPASDAAESAVSIDLHHRHVPLLVDADLVEYANDGDDLRLSDRGSDAVALLDGLTG